MERPPARFKVSTFFFFFLTRDAAGDRDRAAYVLVLSISSVDIRVNIQSRSVYDSDQHVWCQLCCFFSPRPGA